MRYRPAREKAMDRTMGIARRDSEWREQAVTRWRPAASISPDDWRSGGGRCNGSIKLASFESVTKSNPMGQNTWVISPLTLRRLAEP